MDLVVVKADRGLPFRMAEHLFRLEGNVLQHFTDGALRAEVELEHVHQFVADHPEAAGVVRELVPDVEAKAADFTLARAKELTAIRQKVSPGADQGAISKIVDAAVAKAFAQFLELQKSAAAAAAAPKA
jgi:hypothetical protein